LHFAAKYGKSAIVKLLCEHGAQADAKNNDGWTPLIEAVIGLATATTSVATTHEIINYLVQHGKANVNEHDIAHCTALHYAARDGHLDSVKYLISHGAKVNAHNVDVCSALLFCL